MDSSRGGLDGGWAADRGGVGFVEAGLAESNGALGPGIPALGRAVVAVDMFYSTLLSTL